MDQDALFKEVAEENLLREAGRRRFLYADVEELIDHDFLTQRVRLEENVVILRSLLPEDLKRLRARSLAARRAGDTSRWMLASSTWMVNGYEVSMDPKDNAAYHIFMDLYQEMPDSVVVAMMSILTGFQNRITRAIKLVEAYCYEPYSRSAWRMGGTRDVSNTNVVKRLWVSYNLSEDRSTAEDMQWRYTQAIVASMTNKGGKEIGKSLEKSAEKEKDRQRKVIESVVNWVIHGEKADQPKIKIMVDGKEFSVDKIQIAETFEELGEDMKRTLAGEADFHDTMVEQYHASIRKRTEEARQERHERVVAARKLMDERDPEDAAMIGYTEEQIRKLRPDVLENKRTASTGTDRTNSYVYDRYFSAPLKVGVLDQNMKVKTSDRIPAPTPSEEPEEEPLTLQQQIEQRKPTLR